MEKPETRLLEEWKANNDLLKFHEDLKQKRFFHFLTIQTAFLAIFGLLAREALHAPTLVSLLGLVLMSTPPLFIAFYFIRVDARGRAFVDTANTRLLLLEEEWKKLFPDNHFATYGQQFAVLAHRDAAVVDMYLGVRKLNHDPYKKLIHAASAHAGEAAILRLFFSLWIVMLCAALIAVFYHLAGVK